MRSLKCKCLLLLTIAVFAVMSAAGYSDAAQKKTNSSSRRKVAPAKTAPAQKKTPAKNAPAPKKPEAPTSDDIAGGEMLRLAEALRKTSQLERGIPSSQEERDRLYEQYDAEIARLEQKIAEIELKKDALLEAGVSDDEEVEAELAATEKEADDIADRLYASFDIMPEYINAFHPKAASQIVNWELVQDEDTEEEKLLLTILHNRKSQIITHINVLSELTESGDIFFSVKDLPEGLQVVIPKDSGESWAITADGRVGDRKFGNKGYFVAKIVDPDDIPYSELDGESNINEDGSKTFKSGEAFIILRKSSIIVHTNGQ